MDVVFFLIPIGLVILLVAIGAFCWAVNHQQFDDLDNPGHRIIFDDKKMRKSEQD